MKEKAAKREEERWKREDKVRRERAAEAERIARERRRFQRASAATRFDALLTETVRRVLYTGPHTTALAW